ncbi:MAG: hypothetical protein ACJ8KA_04085 [Sulfurifustis sp.]
MKHAGVIKPHMPQTVYRAVALRQRAFLARLPTLRRLAAHASPLDRVLRRMQAPAAPGITSILQLVLRFAYSLTYRQSVQATTRAIHLAAAAQRTELRHLVERKLALITRVIEGRTPTPEAAAAAAPTLLVRERIERHVRAPRVAMAFARTPASVASRQGDATHGEALSPVTARAVRTHDAVPAAQPAALMLPAQELSRVTDHVLQQLDRRVLSYRERTGRI